MKRSIYTILCSLMLLLMSVSIYAQTTINGTVTGEGKGLAFANVFIEGTTTGTTTDINGNYELKSNEPLPWQLVVSYVGYNDQTIQVTDANKARVNIELKAGGVLIGQDIIISASRKREKVQEAPASVSVISARKLETSANATDPTRNLVSTPGVQVQQQSANTINISMRGGAGLFGTGAFPIMDYRSLVGPGIGTFQSTSSGISNIDLQRIEVVRGAGSALYGPGVTQGVVHFITKSPIDFPGVTVEVVAGELNTVGYSSRIAKKVNDKFGFKINTNFRRGNEFTLDVVEDSTRIATFATSVAQPALSPEGYVDVTGTPELLLTLNNLDPDGDGNPMANDWFNTSVNTTLEFRPKDNISASVSGGYNSWSSVFYNEQGEGLSQGNEFWGQARTQIGGLFAQVFGVSNDGGKKDNPSFLYGTGLRTPVARTQLEGQLQYNFDTEKFLNSNWTAGIDYRFAGQDTENLVYGRNEDDDSYSVIGGYVQAKFSPLSKLDVVLAARYDQFNFIDEGAFSPRAALVYKIDPKHTVRASFNRSNSTVSNLQLNIDFPLATVIPGSFDIWLQGNKEIREFGDNPMISWFDPNIPQVPVGTPGLPAGVPYAAVAAPTNAAIIAALMADPTTAPLVPIIEGVLAGIDPTTLGYAGSLSGGFNIFDGSPLTPIDAPISKISTEDAFEVGYKGLVADKLGVTFDIYRITQRNNSQFTAISPAYIYDISGLPSDLGAAVENAVLAPLTQALIDQAGLPADVAAATAAGLANAIGDGYTGGGQAFIGTPLFENGPTLSQLVGALPFHATVPTTGVPNNGATYLAAGYRTFDERTFWGADLGLEYFVNDDISVFGNYSWVDRNDFMQKVVGFEEGGELPSYLNIPKNKFRLGVNYAPELGFRGNISFQHDDSYFASAGDFAGDTEARNLVDAAIGYKFDFGLSIDVTATNVLNNEYRYLPNMPKIGRRTLAKLTYTF